MSSNSYILGLGLTVFQLELLAVDKKCTQLAVPDSMVVRFGPGQT